MPSAGKLTRTSGDYHPRVPHSLQRFKADMFKALAHPTRIRILELLRSGEKTVSQLQEALQLEGSTVSQQLAVLRNRSIVDGRKEGSLVYYRIHDKQVTELLDVARRMFNRHLAELRAL